MPLSIHRSLAALALLAAANAVSAGVITIDPDSYAAGTLISPINGASISYLYHDEGAPNFTYRAAISVTEPSCALYVVCFAPTGTKVFSDGTLINGQLVPTGTGELSAMYYGIPPGEGAAGLKLDGDLISKMHSFQAMRVDFAVPTNYFGADFYNDISDPPIIYAFASDGTVLSATRADDGPSELRYAGPDCGESSGCRMFEQSLSVQHDASDIAFVIYGSTDSALYIDAIRFNVPEPSSLALCAAGIVGLVFFRSRRSPRLRLLVHAR